MGRGKSPLRRDLSRKCLGHDLSVLHDEGVGAELEASEPRNTLSGVKNLDSAV